jgi:hypothetical protein
MRVAVRYQGELDQTQVAFRLVERLTHSEELEMVALMLPPLMDFMNVA